MPLLQDQIKRIFERLKERRSDHAGRSEDSVEDVAEALENVTCASTTHTCDASKDTSIPAYCSMVTPHDAWRRRKPALLVNTITLRDHRQSPEALASTRARYPI